MELAVDIAKEIKARIKEATGLTASAGISYCKFLAKAASDYRKPDGICTIHPDKALGFIAQLPVEDFWGVGKTRGLLIPSTPHFLPQVNPRPILNLILAPAISNAATDTILLNHLD